VSTIKLVLLDPSLSTWRGMPNKVPTKPPAKRHAPPQNDPTAHLGVAATIAANPTVMKITALKATALATPLPGAMGGAKKEYPASPTISAEASNAAVASSHL
jgi:hypothetical protein